MEEDFVLIKNMEEDMITITSCAVENLSGLVQKSESKVSFPFPSSSQ